MLGERNSDDPIEPMISTLEVPGLEVVGQMGVAIARLRRLFRGEVPPRPTAMACSARSDLWGSR